jgi:hypothetical protein
MFIYLDLACIWPDEVYVDRVYDHTGLSRVGYMSSMQVYIEYMQWRIQRGAATPPRAANHH